MHSSWLSWAMLIALVVMEAAELFLLWVIVTRSLGRGLGGHGWVGEEASAKDARAAASTDKTGRPNTMTAESSAEADEADQPKKRNRGTESTGGPENKELRFVVDALFLADSFEFVCSAGRNEVFHYVTGVPVDGTFVLTRIVPVSFSHQSAVRVRVDDRSNIQTLEWLDEWDLALLGHFHSHPGDGAAGTTPSWTDRRFIERLARGGHVAVGAIFSRDGYVRFYADESIRFSVEVKGRHVEKIDENVFKLDLADRRVPIAVYRTEGSAGAGGR